MNAKILWEFPVPSTCIYNTVLVKYIGVEVVLLFDYVNDSTFHGDDKIYNGGIQFNSVLSFRHESEKFTKPSYIKYTYDKLVEFEDSDWVEELYKRDSETANLWKIKHYAIYLDSCGLYEVIANKFKFIDIKEGSLNI